MKKMNFKKINKKKMIRNVIILAIIGYGLFSYYKNSQPTQTNQEVMTSQAMIGSVESLISGIGTLNPANQYEVKSLVKGSILKAPFEEGDLVKKGELLYQISTSEIENNIKSLELGVEKAKSTYEDSLTKRNKLQVTAKESGYLKKLYVKEGDTLQAGKVIADIYDGNTLYLDLLFPSEEVKNAWIGKTASISLNATEEEIAGKVTAVSGMEEVMSGGILGKKVTICVENEGGLNAGDTAEAFIDNISSNNIGAFRAATEISIVAEMDGVINRLPVKEGAWLSKGDTILDLSSSDLNSQIRNAELSITEAELSLKTQKTQEKLYTIKSPIAGQIITKSKKLGDTIDPSADTQAGPLAIVYDLSYLTFQMNIDELQISSIKKGQLVSITTDAFPEDRFDGVIDRISLKGTTNNGVTSYPVIVKVENYGKLLPSMNVTGKISIAKAENVLTIPSSALQEGNLVYVQSLEPVQNADPTVPVGFVPVEVMIGINDGSNVEITQGLKEGDTIYVPFDTTVGMPEGMYY